MTRCERMGFSLPRALDLLALAGRAGESRQRIHNAQLRLIPYRSQTGYKGFSGVYRDRVNPVKLGQTPRKSNWGHHDSN